MTAFTIDVSKLPDPKAKLGQDVEQTGDGSLDFEDAVAKTGQGWFHYKSQSICGLGLMATLVEMLSTGYALPAAQCDSDISTADKGIINAICYVGMSFGSHSWGFSADTRGRRMVSMSTSLMDCVCTVVAALAHSVWSSLVARFFNGFFICGSAAVSFAYSGEFHSDATRARAIVWSGIFVAFATISSPGSAWSVIPSDFEVASPWIEFRSWRSFSSSCAAPGFTSASLIRWSSPRSPKFSSLIGDQEEASETSRSIYATNTGSSPDSYPVKAVRSGSAARRGSRSGPTPDPGTLKARKSAFASSGNMVRQTMPLFRRPHLGPNMLACALEFAILCCANGSLSWSPEIFNRSSQYDASNPGHGSSVCQAIEAHGSAVANGSAAAANSTDDWESWSLPDGDMASPAPVACSNDVDVGAFKNTLIIGGATALAYMLAGYFVNHIGKRNVLIGSMVTSGAAGMVLYFMTTPDSVLGVTCVFIGLATMCVSVVNSIVVELFPTNSRAMAVCSSLMCGRLGTVVGSLLVGSLSELSCPSVFFVSAGVIFGCGFLGFLIPKHPAPEVMPIT